MFTHRDTPGAWRRYPELVLAAAPPPRPCPRRGTGLRAGTARWVGGPPQDWCGRAVLYSAVQASSASGRPVTAVKTRSTRVENSARIALCSRSIFAFVVEYGAVRMCRMPLSVQIRPDITGPGPVPKRAVKTLPLSVRIWPGIPCRASAWPTGRAVARSTTAAQTMPEPATSSEYRPPTGTTVAQLPEPRPQTVAQEPEPRCHPSTGTAHTPPREPPCTNGKQKAPSMFGRGSGLVAGAGFDSRDLWVMSQADTVQPSPALTSGFRQSTIKRLQCSHEQTCRHPSPV